MTPLIRWFYLGCLGVAVLLSATLAQAEEPYCSKPVRVALFEYGVLYRANTNDGIDVRVLDELQRRTGCTFERVVLPRSRIWKELQLGRLDLATAAIPTPERKAYGYLLPYMRARNLVLLNNQNAAKNLDQAAFERGALRLGVVRSFHHEAAYDAMAARLAAQGRVVEAVDVVDLFRLLDRKVVDAIISQPIVFGQYLAASRFDTDITTHDWAPVDQFSLGALVLERASFSDEQAKRWDKLVVDMQRDGTLLKIAREFLPASQVRDLVYTGPRSLD